MIKPQNDEEIKKVDINDENDQYSMYIIKSSGISINDSKSI